MSYIRFGEQGSQVYIYDDCDLGLYCSACALSEGWGFIAGEDVEAMIEHLLEHRRRGHVVPECALQRLREDHPE